MLCVGWGGGAAGVGWLRHCGGLSAGLGMEISGFYRLLEDRTGVRDKLQDCVRRKTGRMGSIINQHVIEMEILG